MNKSIELERLWCESSGTQDDGEPLLWSVEKYAQYSNCKPLDQWIEHPFLFLIGQAGAGKSTYLKQYGQSSNALVIGIKEHGSTFLDVLQADPKWKSFLTNINKDSVPLTIVLDGWDELVDETDCRKRLVQVFATLQEQHRSKIRLRIASRPELPEQKILQAMQIGCPWLFESVLSGTTNESHRLVLISLCHDQVETLWSHFGKGLSSILFWEWIDQKGLQNWCGHVQTLCHLIDSFTQNKSWDSVPELWEEILRLKIAEVDERKIDQLRSHSLPSGERLLDALGELALLYLLGGRDPIPHSDFSNKADKLPTFSELNREAQRFLLSTSVFTPGGPENIHFAQAQEAEFLGARRLNKAKIGLDNQIRLFVHEGGIPENLHGFCKWLAKIDLEWLNFLGKNYPRIAVKSLDSLVEPSVRNRIIKSWWESPRSNRNDREIFQDAINLLSDSSLPWLEQELKRLSPENESPCLTLLVSNLETRSINSEIKDYLQGLLRIQNLSNDLVTKILNLLASQNYGTKEFWIEVSHTWLMTDSGERIPAIAQQLKRYGSSTAQILPLFQAVSPLRQAFRYTEYLEAFFRALSLSDLPIAVKWTCSISVREFANEYKYSWLGAAMEGLLNSLIRENDIDGILTLLAHLWKNFASFDSILRDDQKVGVVFTGHLLAQLQDALIASDVRLFQFRERGLIRNQWIFVGGHQKLMNAFQAEVKDHGYSKRANLLLDVACCIGVSWSEHLELLYSVRQELERQGIWNEAKQLIRILGPLSLGSDMAKQERKYYVESNRDQLERQEREENSKSQKKAEWKNFYQQESKLPERDWFSCHRWLSFGYHIDKSYRHFIPNSAFKEAFWKEKLSIATRENIIQKADEFIRSFKWNDLWTQDFAGRKASRAASFSTHYETLAPLFAWKLLWYTRGDIRFNEDFSTIDRQIWLKYLWSIDAYYHESLDSAQYFFLCQYLDVETLTQIWDEQVSLLGETAKIPDVFLKCDFPCITTFVKNLLSVPFQCSLDSSILQNYIEEHGTSHLTSWFVDWQHRQHQANVIFEWEQLRFLLKCCMECAWDWFLNYFSMNNSDILGFMEKLHMSRDTQGILAIWDWSERVLVKAIELVEINFPNATDPKHEDAYSPNWRDDVADFRRTLLEALLSHGEWDLPKICKEIQNNIPSFDPFGFIEEKAEQNVANKAISSFKAAQIADLLDARGVVVLKDEMDFSKWISSLIDEFEHTTLNGENGLATLLWDERIGLKGISLLRTLKHEEAFSDLLYHWLQWRKLKSPLLPAREVQIYRKSIRNPNPQPHEKGQRLDLDLHFTSLQKPFRIAIEVKRSINSEWSSSGITQLRNYLDRLGIKCGIYIVYGHCSEKKEEMLAQLGENIEPFLKEGYSIIPVVVGI